MLLIKSEELFKKPECTLKQIFRFLGVDAEIKVKNLTPYNMVKGDNKVPPEIITYLDNYFVPHNQELYNLIEKDYGW
jgi:hypothetical protein